MSEAERVGMDEHQPARRAVYVISVAAELAGVHPQTLRIYERRGLIEPARTKGGSRRYSDHDLAQLRSIQELTAEGVSLEGVVALLRCSVNSMRPNTSSPRPKTHWRIPKMR